MPPALRSLPRDGCFRRGPVLAKSAGKLVACVLLGEYNGLFFEMAGEAGASQGRRKSSWTAMGIKFFCPSGHKLNVKSFLAGKKGVCPHCGERFRIPKHSTRGREKERRDAAGNADANGEFEFDSGILRTGPATATAVAPAVATSIATAPPNAVSTAPALPPFPTTGAPKVAESSPAPDAPIFPAINPAPAPAISPAVPAAPASAAAPADPIAEVPTAVWYVRPAAGGQFGPARGELMRGWIAEGRVSADSLVWRDGWADWRNAAQVFPSLGGTAPAPLGGVAVPNVAPRAKPLYAKKKHTQSSSVAALICLVLVCMFLVALLAYVVMAVQ